MHALQLNLSNNTFSAADVIKKAKENMFKGETDSINPEMQLSEAIVAFKVRGTELNSKRSGLT